MLLGVTVYILSSLFNNSNRSLITAIAVMCIPVVWLSVGSGYVELALWLFFTTGIFFFSMYLSQKRILYMAFSITAFALAANVKITVLPVFLFSLFAFFILAFLRKEYRNKYLLNLLLIGLSSFLLILPWLIQTYNNTGYLFSTPVQIFGIKLGNWDSVLQWYKERPRINASGFFDELRVIYITFFDPRSLRTHLSIVSLLLIVFGFNYLIREVLQKKYTSLFYIGFALMVFAVFYSGDFKVIRLSTSFSARFLFPAVIALSAFASAEISRYKKTGEYIFFLIIIMSFIQIVNGMFYGWAKAEFLILLFFGLILLIFLYFNAVVKQFTFRIFN